MEQPELAEDPRYSSHVARGQNAAELDGLIAVWTRTMTAAELDKRMDDFGVVVGPIYTIAEVAKDPHFNDRGMVRRVEDETFGDIAVPGFAPVLTESESDVAWLGPQEVGAHNKEVYSGILGLNDDELTELKNDGII
jgi:crotonobetainyl-CoA:carnitine CoA-transferase CaiB-like acyl-CoA transferase